MTDPTALVVTRDDPRYPALVEGYNHRFVGRPDEVRLATDAEDVRAAVQAAVDTGRRIAVRSGGHCFEDFTAHRDVKVLLDLSALRHVGHDAGRDAFVVEPGARLDHVYRTLYDGWGVTIPAGTCFEVAAGGHFAAGGYGPLSRRDGLVVDHVTAVEAVVVGADGRARLLVGTDRPDDPHHDLWWAHTGGGGGSFGVVTKYWLRTPGTPDGDPAAQLPRAPRAVLRRDTTWSWDGFSEADFRALLRGYCDWYEKNSEPGTPAAALWSNLIITHRSGTMLTLTSVIHDDTPDAAGVLAAHTEAVTRAIRAEPVSAATETCSWKDTWLPSYSWPSDPHGRYKNKAAYLRRGFSDEQITAIHRHLSSPDYDNPMGCLVVTGFGGQVNAVAPDATAVPQRDSILKASYSTGSWTDPADDARHLAWVRAYYRDVYAHSGGVPVPDESTDGSYIGYPDTDLADPGWNTSGTDWTALYFKDNYARLQRAKRAYDPRDVFRHALSVRLP
ncbi:putative oxidoreductase [Streptomyces sp. Tu6071]|uniref:FAD-binding oxidoreductase n=1 Tax=Streptomyces sp. Tu6071 TaxID=355249 RepID=UPI00020E636C|nr:FAD-binding protein [Streptomyces sp. Tu6071]EGJ77096.1 putative oxidoreductase [Streptomyces sp. Tu6071]